MTQAVILTLFILVDFPKHIQFDAISMGQFTFRFRGHRSNCLNHNVFMSLKLVILAKPDDISHAAALHLGKYLFMGIEIEKSEHLLGCGWGGVSFNI